MLADLAFALTSGLLGGFGHCIGMCGPLVTSFTISRERAFSPFLSTFLYHTGRITTYGMIGGVMGVSGSFVTVAGRIAGIQNSVILAAGCLMVLMGLGITGIYTGFSKSIERHNAPVFLLGRRLLASSSPLRFFAFGLALGLLPCGLSYSIFIASASSGGFLPGMLTALAFGFGTLPAMLLFGIVISWLGTSMRIWLYRASGALVILMGLYFIYRGLVFYAEM